LTLGRPITDQITHRPQVNQRVAMGLRPTNCDESAHFSRPFVFRHLGRAFNGAPPGGNLFTRSALDFRCKFPSRNFGEWKQAVATTKPSSLRSQTAEPSSSRWPGSRASRMARRVERANYRPIGDGEGIHWPDLDEDISVESLLAGRSPASRSSPFGEGWSRAGQTNLRAAQKDIL